MSNLLRREGALPRLPFQQVAVISNGCQTIADPNQPKQTVAGWCQVSFHSAMVSLNPPATAGFEQAARVSYTGYTGISYSIFI